MSLKRSRSVVSAFSCAIVLSLASLLIAHWSDDRSESDDVSDETTSGIEENNEALLLYRDTELAPDMPGEAAEIVKSYDQAATHIRRRAALEIRERRLQALRRLKALQDMHTRAAQLDEAVAIRDTIRRMLEAGFPSIDNPGTMGSYTNQIGKSVLVRVTGRVSSSVYGTDFFTYDSDIATACVHAGVLRNGETGVVIVTMISARKPHVGSIKNGVRSHDYGVYPASYTVRRWKPSVEEIELGSLRLE